jgi:hypothetical protein
MQLGRGVVIQFLVLAGAACLTLPLLERSRRELRARAAAAAGKFARDRELVERVRLMEVRVERKRQLVDQLLAGRLTLLEAAAGFRDLNRGPPALNWSAFRHTVPGGSDEERHCNQVIQFAACEMERVDPKRADEVHAALTEQLHEHLRRGTLVLPGEDSAVPTWR